MLYEVYEAVQLLFPLISLVCLLTFMYFLKPSTIESQKPAPQPLGPTSFSHPRRLELCVVVELRGNRHREVLVIVHKVRSPMMGCQRRDECDVMLTSSDSDRSDLVQLLYDGQHVMSASSAKGANT
jgi:hypothetical protein